MSSRQMWASAAWLCLTLACTPPPVCTAGAAEACACADGSTGTQACNPAGTAWSECLCTPRCTSDTCLGHGVCTVDASGPRCTCFAAYGGVNCGACAAGASDPEGDGTCALDQCAAAQCNGRGVCAVDGTCACFAAYAGARCESCGASFQDHDGDGVCAPACAASTCGGHGTCSDSSGAARCTCRDGWVGEGCERCGPGLQDFDGDGTCQAGCSSAQLSCAAPTFCSDASGVATCVCPVGYSTVGTTVGGTRRCAWAGVVRDPELTLADAGWLILVDAGVQSSAQGSVDPGLVAVSGPALERFVLDQEIDLPPSATPYGVVSSADRGLTVRVGNAQSEPVGLAALGCFGDDLTSGRQHVQVGVTDGLAGYSGVGTATLDHLELAPRADCPRPGVVTNGSFDDSSAWEINNGRISNGALTFSLGPCFGGFATGRVSFPSTWGNALAVSYSVVEQLTPVGGHAPIITARPGTLLLTPLEPVVTGNSKTAVFCAGALRGQSREVLLQARNGGCTGTSNLLFSLDDVRVVDEPACALRDGIANPSFGLGNAAWGTFGFAATTDATTQSMVMANSRSCTATSVVQEIRVPSPVGAAGPAVVFSHRLSGAGNLSVVLGNHGTAVSMGAWQTSMVCIPPQLAGGRAALTFQVEPTATCAAGAEPDVAIDDVSLTTSPQCPAP